MLDVGRAGNADQLTTTSPRLLTFGHGTAEQERIVELLRRAGAGLVVDVRRFPGSRRHPHVARDALSRWLPAAGIDYRREPRLGGRRATADRPGPDTWWQVEAFRAYAAHTRTPEFRAAPWTYAAFTIGGGPNQVVRASLSPVVVPSPTHAT
ncbi:hypothetical protein BH11ACT1_BH11ACT1_02770 [soil metagenome]